MLHVLVDLVLIVLQHLRNGVFQLRAILTMLSRPTHNFVNVVLPIAGIRLEHAVTQIIVHVDQLLPDNLLGVFNVLHVQVHAVV